jgi:hypothetical protein
MATLTMDAETMNSTETLASDAAAELRFAMGKHGPMASAHEGYAVILEELDELWDEVKLQRRDVVAMRKEAMHVAAMALRFVRDVCDHEG